MPTPPFPWGLGIQLSPASLLKSLRKLTRLKSFDSSPIHPMGKLSISEDCQHKPWGAHLVKVLQGFPLGLRVFKIIKPLDSESASVNRDLSALVRRVL